MKKCICFTIFCFFAMMNMNAMAANEAPTGIYRATTGESVGVHSGKVLGDGGLKKLRKKRQGNPTQTDKEVMVRLNSYSSSSELEQLKAVKGDKTAFLNLLRTFNHGTISIGGKSFPVNLAYSVRSGSGHRITLLSAQPFAGISRKIVAQGRGGVMGCTKLTVDAGGNGTGAMFTATAVGFAASGEVTAQGGSASRRTVQLENVSLQ